MNTKRSYLDILNTGRQRRSGGALEEINRTLDQLENRLERALETRELRSDGEEDIAQRMERLSSRAGMRRPEPDARRDDTPRQEEPRAAVGGIADELKAMRDDMHAGIRREFAALREELTRIVQNAPTEPMDDRLRSEFQDLSEAIAQLAERSDDKGVKMLRLELEQLKGSLGNLAREDTVRALDERWDGFEDRLSGRAPDPAMERLAARLEEISAAVHGLPESLSLRSLEERVHTLAEALEQFVVQDHRNQPDLYAMVEERLDEISRAITASAALARSPSFDTSVLDRIEARIGSLARQLDEVVQDQPGGMVVERLNALSERIEEVARRVEVPQQVVDRLATHITRISERLDTGPAQEETALLFEGFENRFARLSDLVERRQEDAIQHGQSLFQELERRLEEMAERLDHRGSARDEPGIMDAIDHRFAELAARIDQSGNTSALRALEARLEEISGRLQDGASQNASVNPDVFRNLEAQVSNLAARLAASSQDGAEELAPRLDNIERSIDESRADVLRTAHQAAEEAVERFATAPGKAADGRLKEEIEKLHSLTRKADERNTKTFEAIHDTLLKIVDRLGALEAGTGFDSTEKIAVSRTPSLDPAGFRAEEGIAEASSKRTPAEAAAAAAEAALMDDDHLEASEEHHGRSVLGGLSRAFAARRAHEGVEREEPELTVDVPEENEPALSDEHMNEPLEPGSGAPDLNSIMRRVRDERSKREHGSDEAAKADFIAAARRAAQAAAAEAEILKDRRADSGEKRGKSALGRIVSRHRKKLLLSFAAVIMVAGGIQVAWWMLQDGAPGFQLAQAGNRVEEQATAETESPSPSRSGVVTTSHAATPSEQETREQTQTTASTKAQNNPTRPATVSTRAQPQTPSSHSTSRQTGASTSSESAEDTTRPSPMTTAAVSPAPAPAAVKPAWLDLPAVPAEIGPEPLREAASEGAPNALYEVARRYAEGHGVNADMTKAAQFYEMAAEQGLAPAQYRIGNLYEKGTGVERDIAKAKMWYQLAAEQGNASAMHNLGVLYAMGADGTTDNETAARWFTQAAQFGVADSQFNLGILSAKGVGVPRDLDEAYKWFDIVARRGDPDAAAKRDEIAETMAPADLATAKGKAKLWKPRPADPEANIVDIPEAWGDGPTVTSSLDTTKAIKNIQLILNKNGFAAGPADGVMGEKTRSAIRAFQATRGMQETGEINDALVRALLEANENAQ